MPGYAMSIRVGREASGIDVKQASAFGFAAMAVAISAEFDLRRAHVRVPPQKVHWSGV